MIALTADKKEALHAACDRAEKSKLDIRHSPCVDNIFYVQSENDRTVYYTVILARYTNGEVKGFCNCISALVHRKLCKHIGLASKTYKEMLNARPVCIECGELTGFKVANALTDYCQQCINWQEECVLVD